MPSEDPERVIHAETIVEASLDTAWEAWTAEEGVKLLLAPAFSIREHVDGPRRFSLARKLSPAHEEQKAGRFWLLSRGILP
jgi:hypothetical protein